ncbi:iron ABC transporter permease [Burkholderiales bacterium YL45]|uniref:Iron ABC transporter permease n=2 Tax=Turicimonas muris TaxID=1796652 RepID=A0A227KRC7_9BURK|nr:iron ABC transporter permease [Turicimonas muris]ANU66808.1 iron ABC transporter permease [Burkholderiales bacterium YL45]OXE50155.1 iron ABC transporter permease [Turicimonas muris]QQQ95676.1 iron ABC transporter permease [Turicimonas muris]
MVKSSEKNDLVTKFTVFALWMAMGVFVVYPLVRLLGVTFWVDGHFTFENLKPFLDNWYDRRAIVNSIVLATAVGLTGTIIGFIFAFAVTRLSMPAWLKFAISAVTLLPLISPPFTSSIALTLSLGPNGILLQFFGLDNFNFYGFWGTYISETLTYFPIAFMTLTTILLRIDPNLEDAAYSLGSSSFNVFRTVTFPLAAPGLANAFLLVFSCSLADFATPQVLGGHSFPVLPTQAYLQITGMYDFKGGAALSFLLIIPALIVYGLQNFWVSRRSFVTVTGKAGGRSSIKGPGPLITAVVLGTVTFISAFVLYLYSIILIGSLIKVWGVDNSLTFENYHYVFTFGSKAIKDTLIIACVGTPIGGLLAVLIGYVTKWLKVKGHKTLETISLLNYTLPGTVVGIAYIIAFNDKPIVLTGTVYILIAAYVFRYSSAGIRNVIASLTQIDPSIEEASTSLGASSAYTFWKITVPLVLPAVMAGMKYLFIHSMTAISATIFLVSVHWSLITTRILECMTELQFAQACAFSIVLIIIVFIASGVMSLIAKTVCPVGNSTGGLR